MKYDIAKIISKPYYTIHLSDCRDGVIFKVKFSTMKSIMVLFLESCDFRLGYNKPIYDVTSDANNFALNRPVSKKRFFELHLFDGTYHLLHAQKSLAEWVIIREVSFIIR